ncbi:hypothetical protein KRR26_14200 [Corallococcus sp. M34]|uniref:deaminase n=1 Tax=Citreicoccus inhibens TaxID=2849499 RepID=UPI001C244BE7|nr:deaminase [Citreicoccus inhibens]MBU8896766.1 hypothetical protein [Citreicoccus inhibens]
MKRALSKHLYLLLLIIFPITASARWYDAGTGRFLSEDPLLGDILATQQRLPQPIEFTPWLYASSNPLRHTDPDGRQSLEPSAPGNGLALMCGAADLTGLTIKFCQDSRQVENVTLAMNQGEVRGKMTSTAAAIGLYTGGPKGLAAGVALGYALDVASQTYEDPNHVRTLDQIDHFGALERGIDMCAVPPALALTGKTGRLGKVAAVGVALYFSGQAIGQGAGQVAVSSSGDYGRCVYGASLVALGAVGAQYGYGELRQSLPVEHLPTWMFSDIEAEGLATNVPGIPPPIRINFRSAEYRQASMLLAQRRAQLGLPRAGSSGDTSTLAMLEIDGRRYFGQEAGIPKSDRPAFLELVREAALENGANGGATVPFVDHAEGTVFYRAFMDNAQGKRARLFVDRELCPYCLRSISNARHILGLKEVEVHDPKYPEGRVYPLGQ